jgi:acyl-CoA reductase-like NAD-dependent aldehyde dehydrogenase
MSINVISPVHCTSVHGKSAARRPLIDVLVERLARRLLSWSERPVRERREYDARWLDSLANERSVATARPVRWY